MSSPKASPEYISYFKELEIKLQDVYSVAERARAKGLDPETHSEPKITRDIAERVEKMLGPKGVAARIGELSKYDRRELSFIIAEEIARGRYGHTNKKDAADQAIRTALAIMTEGVTVAPIEGIPKIEVKTNPDRTQFLSIYFAGPIRPAGGTAQALTLVIADHVRRALSLDKWQPSDAVVQRFIEEVRVYERSVRRFQYHVTDKDVESAMRQIPVEPTGVATDPYEVSNYRDIPGIETNRLRGGALIVVVDGVVGRAQKLAGACESLGMPGWEWLKKLGKRKNDEGESTAAFMDEIIVGRPVFSFPGAKGGFRLRYGRSRNTGLAAVGVHPATMIMLNKFLTTGVQMRTELPGKSAATCPVDGLEGPIIKLKDGSVIRVESEEDAFKLLNQVDNILYLGDYLANAGDFIQNNKNLLPAGYDEQQWLNDVEACFSKLGLEAASQLSGLSILRLNQLLSDPVLKPTPSEAINLTQLDIPLHPRYNYYWSAMKRDELLTLRTRLIELWEKEKKTLPNNPYIKDSLERLLIPHLVVEGKLVFGDETLILERCLALDIAYKDFKNTTSLEIISELAGFMLKEKAPIFVGARMGRPEKAKERKMEPYIHSLFPVAEEGGPQRDISRVEKGRTAKVELSQRRCLSCGTIGNMIVCQKCGGETQSIKRCTRCGIRTEADRCPQCKSEVGTYAQVNLDLRGSVEDALKLVGGSLPSRIKCVKSLMNETRTPEHLGKGILRARYDLSVFKDGTLRYDLTDVPLTHFKPSEAGVSIEKLKELGYTTDMNGEPLASYDQMLELKVQDILLPEGCGDYLVKVSKFLDDELRDFYKLEPFYRVKNRDELLGHIVLGLAPHTSAAIIGRLVGWTKVRNCYAHPLWHAAKRRNCDGDEDAVMLVLDPLLNFSETFLPQQSGGKMDAPLFIIPNLTPSEVDKEAHNVDVNRRYPPEFYKLCSEGAESGKYASVIDTIGNRLGTESQYQGIWYTVNCSSINLGSHQGAYTSLETMIDKLDSQMELAQKIKAVDVQEVAVRLLNSHFMKDIVGNLRAFTAQTFRCTKCNKKYRRPALVGKCTRCGGHIQMTVHKGSIEKYLTPALQIVDKYNLDRYYADRLKLVKEEINGLFIEDGEDDISEDDNKQFSLTDFMRSEKVKSP